MKTLNDYSLMPVGPHKGMQMQKVPAKYLLTMQNPPANVAAYIKHAERTLRWEVRNEKHHAD